MNNNKSLLSLFLINGIFVFASSLFGPLYAVYIEKLGTGILSASLTWSVMLVTTTLVTMVVAKYGDKVKEKEYLLIAGFIIRSIAWFSYTIIQNVPQLIIVQVLVGIGEAVGSPAFDAIFADHLDKKSEIMEYSGWKVLYNLVAALGTGIGGVLVVSFGFNIMFYVMSTLAATSAVIAITRPRKLL